jgi:DNA invertase Pin-like site-specific DNA recombinase
MRGKFVSYLRVSTDRWGQTGHGIDAQRAAVASYLNGGDWQLLGEFVEVESGKRQAGWPPRTRQGSGGLQEAQGEACHSETRSVGPQCCPDSQSDGWQSRFYCCDMPQANRLTIHVLAAVAELSDRTKAGLAAAKARGVKLGGPRLCKRQKRVPREVLSVPFQAACA